MWSPYSQFLPADRFGFEVDTLGLCCWDEMLPSCLLAGTAALVCVYMGTRRQALPTPLFLAAKCFVWGFAFADLLFSQKRSEASSAWCSMPGAVHGLPTTPVHSPGMVTESFHSSNCTCFISFRQYWMLLLNSRCMMNNLVFSHVITVFIASINKYNELQQSRAVSSLKSYPLLEAEIDSTYSSLTVIICQLLQKVTSNPEGELLFSFGV